MVSMAGQKRLELLLSALLKVFTLVVLGAVFHHHGVLAQDEEGEEEKDYVCPADCTYGCCGDRCCRPPHTSRSGWSVQWVTVTGAVVFIGLLLLIYVGCQCRAKFKQMGRMGPSTRRQRRQPGVAEDRRSSLFTLAHTDGRFGTVNLGAFFSTARLGDSPIAMRGQLVQPPPYTEQPQVTFLGKLWPESSNPKVDDEDLPPPPYHEVTVGTV